MDKLSCFSLSTENHVAHLVMNRPEVMNTMHPMWTNSNAPKSPSGQLAMAISFWGVVTSRNCPLIMARSNPCEPQRSSDVGARVVPF